MSDIKLQSRLEETEKYFTKDEFKDTVDLARTLYENGQYVLCERTLERLPSKERLLRDLVGKLEGKSVYRSLEKIIEGKVENDITTVKGLSSLLTHVAIEYEHGNTEFRMLIPNILEKLSEVIFDVLQ